MIILILLWKDGAILTNLSSIGEIIEGSLRLSDIFQHCPYRILKNVEIVNFQQGQFLCYQGQCLNNLFIIISGKVEVYHQAENGRRHIKYCYEEGTFIGELEVYDQSPASSYVEALTPVKLFKVSREKFLQWLNADSHFSEFLYRQISKKYYNYSLTTSENILYSVKYRLCHYLILICNERNLKTNVRVELDKDKFIKLFSVSIRSLNRILHSLRDLNVIEVTKDSILIKDVKLLEEIQEDEHKEG